ncbi:MAG: hypothetical protein Kow0099_17810 [Candidatus Abyssubacteria bacterium]
MKTLQLECGKCKAPISLPLPEASVQTTCPICDAYIRIEAFPALLRRGAQGRRGETLTADDESSCYYHPAKKAVAVCEGCGRFLCSLCDIEMDGRHICSACIERGGGEGSVKPLKNEVVRYDDIALTLAIIPMIFYCITIFTAPAALYISIRHWNTPMSVLPRSRWRFVVAILLSVVQLAAWSFFGARLLGRVLLSA